MYSMMYYVLSFHYFFTSIHSFLLDSILLPADGFVRDNEICSSGVDNVRFDKLDNS